MATTKRTKKETPCEEFTRTQAFFKRHTLMESQEDYDFATIWTMGTHTFSPAAPARPYSFPYWYITGSSGSGKSTFAVDVLSYVCRNHKATVDVTGATLFRMLGSFDEESGEVIPHYPTLIVDEIDAKYSGQRDEQFRGVADAGYKQGTVVDRAMGKTTIAFPVYCPKAFVGIENGHLPETLVNRCIRTDLKKHSQDELQAAGIEYPYPWKVAQEADELQQMLSDWAKREAMILRDYDPPIIEGLSGRQWEVCRTLVQLARAAGIEQRIRAALKTILSRAPEREDGRVAVYRVISDLFDKVGSDKLTTRQILAALSEAGVRVAGQNGRGLQAFLAKDGIGPRPGGIRLTADHPGMRRNEDGTLRLNDAGEPQWIHRGYMRFSFDDAFVDYLGHDEDDE